MDKIITTQPIASIYDYYNKQGKKIVVAGGCFDLIHPGHITFLTSAKAEGDILVILLESDEAIKLRKGHQRPFYTQNDRAIILSALQVVDTIIMLNRPLSDTEYDTLILSLKPDIIATTDGDEYLHHKKRQAELSGAELKIVTRRLDQYSTSSLAKKIATYE